MKNTPSKIIFYCMAAVLLAGLSGCAVTDTGEEAKELPFAVFHVHPDGDDAHPGTEQKPFATLARTRDAVRAVNAEMTGDIVVSVAPGDYFLDETFVLTNEDAGRNGYRVRYTGVGQPGAARLIGGVRVTDWEPYRDGIFRAPVAEGHVFNTLYENGIRARKARFPSHTFEVRFPMSGAPYLNAEGGTDTELIWREGDMAPIDVTQLGDHANLVFWPWAYADWHKVTRRITRIDAEKRSITVPENKGRVAIGRQARYYIEGARMLLDQPGEFYLDQAEGMLYYWPRFGEPEAQEIIAPALHRIIFLDGLSAEHPLRDMDIEGLTLAYTDTFDAMTGTTLFPWSVTTGYGAHGALHLRYTEDIEVRFNHILGAGLTAIYLDRSNKRTQIYGNWIEDAGLSGIAVAYHRQAREYPQDVNEDNVIDNNLIHRLGGVGVDSAGINIWGARNNTVRHCKIFDGARYGVSIRGNFAQLRRGEDREDMADTNRHVTEGNRVEYTHLYRLGQDSGDMGAVHMAGISSRTVHPVNYFEQLLIEDIAAHPSMQDIPPNGIFLDYPEGVTDQVFRDIRIRATRQPFRSNNTDIRHTYDNCSWREDFDPDRMELDRIGLRPDFPSHFGPPPDVTRITIMAATSDDSLRLSWEEPDAEVFAGVWITAEGDSRLEPVFVPAGSGLATAPKPSTDRIVLYRIQSAHAAGHRSQGVLVRAGVDPGPVHNLQAVGQTESIHLSWAPPEGTISGYRVRLDKPGSEDLILGADATEAVLDGLVNHRVYDMSVDVLDMDGSPWPGAPLRHSAGEGIPVPHDAAAWWTFDEPEIREGLSIGDASGHGNTLFVGNDKVALAEGRFGMGLRFDGETAYARVLGPAALAIGRGDYAISVWIRQAGTTFNTQRFLDFGGTGVPGICLMANERDVRLLFHDGENRYDPFYRGLDMVGQWKHVVVNIVRDGYLTLYVNGEELARADISAGADHDIPPAPDFFLGRYVNSNPRFNWPGDIDQLRIFQRALTPAEIVALYEESDG